MSALEAYVSKRQKQKAEKIAIKVFQYSKCYTLKCFLNKIFDLMEMSLVLNQVLRR